ncbi:MAG: hypothetical protein P4N59_07455 [Negativicutes bacterium]|nr:hypothetical protein [Negativicutes bacterium]
MCTAAAGAGLQAFGALYGGLAARSQQNAMANYYQYQAGAVKTQADLASNNIEQTAGMQISHLADQGRQVLGAQRVGMGANGISSDSFSYQQVQDTTVAQNKLDQLAVAYNADTKSWGIENNANIEAAGYESAASNARKAGNMALVGGLLNGAAQFSDTWAKWQQTSQGQTPATIPQTTNPMKVGGANGKFTFTPDTSQWDNLWKKPYQMRSIYGGQ